MFSGFSTARERPRDARRSSFPWACPNPSPQGFAALAGGVPGARWVPAGNMHVTVRYLGELDDVLAGEVSSGLAEIGGSGFSLEAGGVGCFGKRGAPRLLYAGVRPHEDLKRLRRRVEGLFHRLRIPPDGRKYHPHITLARLKGASPERVGRFLEATACLCRRRSGSAPSRSTKATAAKGAPSTGR